jgi:hypothetical protein
LLVVGVVVVVVAAMIRDCLCERHRLISDVIFLIGDSRAEVKAVLRSSESEPFMIQKKTRSCRFLPLPFFLRKGRSRSKDCTCLFEIK